MRTPPTTSSWAEILKHPLVISTLKHPLFLQIAPLVVLIAVPTFAFFIAHTGVATRAVNSFVNLGNAVELALVKTFAVTDDTESEGMSYLPWNWLRSPAGDGANGSRKSRDGKSKGKLKKDKHGDKKAIRTRAEQLEMNGVSTRHSEDSDKADGRGDEDVGYYPGLVNISGTYCFMNSTIQALSSLSYLQPHIDTIHAKAEALDVPTPVIDALKELLQNLNVSTSAPRAIRPNNIITALSTASEPGPDGRSNHVAHSLFNSREHQDAQELFQLVSECIKTEIGRVDKEAKRDKGFGALSEKDTVLLKEIGKSVFDGLTANRRSCVVCGYTEAVMHFAFDSWQLSVPRMAGSCRLEDCLEEYTRLEILKDCICRKCSLIATQARLKQELAVLEEAVHGSSSLQHSIPSTSNPPSSPKSPKHVSASKKRRLKEVTKFEARVRDALAQGRIEDELKDVRIEKVFSPASTKQAMVARPPQVLALHLNRSVHHGTYASKNNVRVLFPEVLDLTPFTTSGSLSTVPTASISTPSPHMTPLRRSTTPTPATYNATSRTIYRLSAVVCHYGNHSFGHYVCFRRKPKPMGYGAKRWVPPRIVDPLRDDDDLDGDAAAAAYLSSAGPAPMMLFEDPPTRPGRGWLRISDDSVREVGIESVLAEGTGAFMLYYEKAQPPRRGVYRGSTLPPSSSAVIREGSSSSRYFEKGSGRVYAESLGARTSEETLRPLMKTLELNGSVGSLVSEVGVGVQPPASKAASIAVDLEQISLSSSPKTAASIIAPLPKDGSLSRSPSLASSLPSSRATSLSAISNASLMAGSMATAFPVSSSSSSPGRSTARIIRSVAAGRGRSASASVQLSSSAPLPASPLSPLTSTPAPTPTSTPAPISTPAASNDSANGAQSPLPLPNGTTAPTNGISPPTPNLIAGKTPRGPLAVASTSTSNGVVARSSSATTAEAASTAAAAAGPPPASPSSKSKSKSKKSKAS